MAKRKMSNRRKYRVKNICFTIGLVVCAAVFLFCAYRLTTILLEYRAGDKEYESLAALGPQATPKLEESSTPAPNGDIEGTSAPAAEPLPIMDFTQLKAENTDAVAWITIPGTAINYPIVQGTDNEYYLTHTLRRSVNGAGALFLDEINASDFSDQQAYVYGHNMKNGSMFHDLMQYKKQDFFDAHKRLYLYTPTATYEMELFSIEILRAKDVVRQANYGDEYAQHIEQLAQRSVVQGDAGGAAEHGVLTLITCTYEYDDARLLAHAKVLRSTTAADKS